MVNKQRKRELKLKRHNKRLGLASSHLGASKGSYKEAGIFKQHLIKTNESRSINQPKSRFTARVKKECQGSYEFDRDKHTIKSRPKEWIRLNQSDVNAVKILTKTKHL